jgi:tRNA (Thr-GGU) A37 N-methylase
MFSVKPVGLVQSPLKLREQALKQGLAGLRVGDLEAFDDTPIIDLKPVPDARER